MIFTSHCTPTLYMPSSFPSCAIAAQNLGQHIGIRADPTFPKARNPQRSMTSVILASSLVPMGTSCNCGGSRASTWGSRDKWTMSSGVIAITRAVTLSPLFRRISRGSGMLACNLVSLAGTVRWISSMAPVQLRSPRRPPGPNCSNSTTASTTKPGRICLMLIPASKSTAVGSRCSWHLTKPAELLPVFSSTRIKSPTATLRDICFLGSNPLAPGTPKSSS
mmetsp:Transcript_13052/g.31510  ORF Transcript_13052/g.31510 Transcript_13052/m.31510 type:complete len:221 (+) Transcript_13052:4437-5099(+)